MKSPFFAALILILLSLPAFAEDVPVLAKIGEEKITMSDLNRIIGYYAVERQKILEQNPQYKINLLKRIVQGKVISKLARDKGFDKRADIKEQIELLVNDFLTIEHIKKEVIDKIKVSEEDMNLYYKSHKNEFTVPEQVKARHILIRVDKSASEEDKKKAKEKAEALLKQIKKGEDFEKLASEFSEDPGSKKKGGDLGYFSRGKMIKPFEDAAFSLKPGEVSEVVETPFGYHIIKVADKKPEEVQPFEKVKDEVRNKVFEEFRQARVKEFIDKALRDAKAEIYPEKLSQQNDKKSDK
jgi:peptidyl-prolyl cis-trans isomerase C